MLTSAALPQGSVNTGRGAGCLRAGLSAGPRGCQTILYLSARELEVGIIESPQRGARFTVYQPGFVITSREVMWSLRNGKSKEGEERWK